MANPPGGLWQQMIRVHGYAAGNDAPGNIGANRCGACVFLIAHQYTRTYYKCSKAKVTGGPATDWQKHWEGCGLFEPRPGILKRRAGDNGPEAKDFRT